MMARAGSGWQTVLADLSLILFMVMAAAVQQAPAAANPPTIAALPTTAEPVAVWSAAPGGPDLGQWLADQPADPRQRLVLRTGRLDQRQPAIRAADIGDQNRMREDAHASAARFL